MCAETGAALVIMHTIAPPKQRLHDRVAGRAHRRRRAARSWRQRIELALARGVAFEQLMLDPGPDFSKTPAQTIAVLRALPDLHALGRPILLAVSRKDFVGALTGRAPRERLAGTLAAVGHGVEAGAHMFRLHDVAAAADYPGRPRGALRGAARSTPRCRSTTRCAGHRARLTPRHARFGHASPVAGPTRPEPTDYPNRGVPHVRS